MGKHQFSFGGGSSSSNRTRIWRSASLGRRRSAAINALLGGVVGTFTYDPSADGNELAVAIRRMVCGGYDPGEAEADVVAGIPRRIFDRMERGARPRRQLFLHKRRDQFDSALWGTPPSASTTRSSCRSRASALAWSPFGEKTVIRAGFGMYNDLQDALGYRMDQNAPFNPTMRSAACPWQTFPSRVSSAGYPPAGRRSWLPGGVQPNLKTPTLISYSLRVQQRA